VGYRTRYKIILIPSGFSMVVIFHKTRSNFPTGTPPITNKINSGKNKYHPILSTPFATILPQNYGGTSMAEFGYMFIDVWKAIGPTGILVIFLAGILYFVGKEFRDFIVNSTDSIKSSTTLMNQMSIMLATHHQNALDMHETCRHHGTIIVENTDVFRDNHVEVMTHLSAITNSVSNNSLRIENIDKKVDSIGLQLASKEKS